MPYNHDPLFYLTGSVFYRSANSCQQRHFPGLLGDKGGRDSRARRVELRLEEESDSVRLEIKDDGQDFEPGGEFPGHLGLCSMRERVERLGGIFEIESAPGKGTRLDTQIPRKKSSEI